MADIPFSQQFIPELENPDTDAYWIDLDEVIHPLKCIGVTPWGEKVFDTEEQPMETDYTNMFHTAQMVKLKNSTLAAMGIRHHRTYFTNDRIFVPNLSELKKLMDDTDKLTKIYLVEDGTVLVYQTKWVIDKDSIASNINTRMFTNEDDAIAFFNKVKNERLAKYKDALARLTLMWKKAKMSLKETNVQRWDDIIINVADVIPGEEYMVRYEHMDYGPYKAGGMNEFHHIVCEGDIIIPEEDVEIVKVPDYEEYLKSKPALEKIQAVNDMERLINYGLRNNIEIAENCGKPANGDHLLPRTVIAASNDMLKGAT